MQQLARAEQQAKEAAAMLKKDLELSEGEKSQKIKDMEKSQRQWKQEKDELLRVRIDQTSRPLFALFSFSLRRLPLFLSPFLALHIVYRSCLVPCRKWRKRKRSSSSNPRS